MLQIVVPLIVSFAVTVLLGPVIIPWLRKLHASQTEREYLKTHVAKNGTPTMGGIMILAGLLAGTLISAAKYPKILPVLVLAIGFGLIGFLDDFLKVALHRSDGLFAWQKMFLQIVVTTIFDKIYRRRSLDHDSVYSPEAGYYSAATCNSDPVLRSAWNCKWYELY